MAVPVLAAKAAVSIAGKQAAKNAAKKTIAKGVAAGTKRATERAVQSRMAASLKRKASQQMMDNIGKVSKQMASKAGLPTNIYDAGAKVAQQALSGGGKQSVKNAAGDAIAKGAETAVNKGLDAASKLGPAPVKIAASLGKKVMNSEAAKNKLKNAISDSLPNLKNESDDEDEAEDSFLNPFGKKKKKGLGGKLMKMGVPMMVMQAASIILPILLVVFMLVSLGSCAAGMFGLTSGGGESSRQTLEEDPGVFVPQVQVHEAKGFCDDEEELASTGSGDFTKYALSEEQIIDLAALCQREQGTPEGAAAEASLIVNIFERDHGDQAGDANALHEWVRTSPWFGAARTQSLFAQDPPKPNGEDLNQDIVAVVKEVIVNGKHTLPRYVDEHDFKGDISSISTGSKDNNSDYKPHETVIQQGSGVGGGTWTFYSFPAEGSDPFGYTNKAKRDEYGDDCYSFSDLGVGGSDSDSSSESSSTSSSSNSGGAFTDRGDCIEKNKKSNTGDWVLYNQVTPNWKGWDNTSFGSSCGQVAMAMVCATYGGDGDKYTPNWLRKTEMRYGDEGLNQPGCVSYMNAHQDEFHLKASSGHWDTDSSSWDKMKDICDAGGCIVLYQVYYSSGGMHWVTVIDVEGDKVTVANPATGAIEDFSKANIISKGCPNKGGGAPCALYFEKV